MEAYPSNSDREKKESDFVDGVFDAVGTVHGIFADAQRKLPAYGSLGGFFGIGGPHDSTVRIDGFFAFQDAYHHGAAGHEFGELPEKGTLLVHSVKIPCLPKREAQHFQGDDFQSRLFVLGENASNQISFNAIRLDDRQGSFHYPFVSVFSKLAPRRAQRVSA